jgi:ABC-type cobalt transport system substrate-binding protein
MSATVKEKDEDTNLLTLAVEFHRKRPKTCISLFVGVVILLILGIVVIVIAVCIALNEKSRNCEGNVTKTINAIQNTKPKYELLSRNMPTKQSSGSYSHMYLHLQSQLV